jgi:DNA-binding SARP family transcriptional activator/Tfp pilus assembly protein PilF
MTGCGEVESVATSAKTGGVRLWLLGGFRLEDEDGRPIPISLRKAEALLAYLAVSAGQSASRQTLAALLWSDFAQARARQSLRQVVSALGKTLRCCGTPVLRVTDQAVSLEPGAVLVDTLELARLTDEGSPESLAAAVPIYAGELLEGLRLDAPEFEDWLAVTRGELRDLALRAMAALLAHQEDVGDMDGAAATARRILAIDPFREDIHRRLMQLYAENGMRSAALAHYRECREVLCRELDVLPDDETTRLYRSIRDQASAGARRALSQEAAAPWPESGSLPSRQPAEALEQLQAEALAAHYRGLASRLGAVDRGGDGLKALILAARFELDRGAPLAARRILEEGRTLLRAAEEGSNGDVSSALDIHLALAVCAEESNNPEGAHAALEAAEPLAERLEDAKRRVQILIVRSRLRQRGGEETVAWDCARRALALAVRAGDESPWLDSERFIARLHLAAGPGDRLARDLAARSRCGGAAVPPAEAARTGVLLALTRAAAGDFAEAQEDCDEAVRQAGKSRRPDGMTAAYEAQGLVRLWRGEAGAALDSFARALEIAEARGDLLRGYVLCGFRGLALLAAGERGAARPELERAVTMAERLGTRFLAAFFKAGLAESAWQSGQEHLASGLTHEALSLAAETNQPWAGSIAARTLAEAFARPKGHDLGRAERAIARAVATQRGLGLPFELARSLSIQARILDARGKSRQSGEAGREAGALFRRMGLSRGAGLPELRISLD